ncbi:MAG TPA: helix-turn-helix domain-containing protein [Ornithinibacter sp.]|nr:helix-turn-helix domain-containing protein [Ornithinibacter sp.]
MKNTPPMGPTPTPPPADGSEDAVDPARRRVLRTLAAHRSASLPTVNDLVATVGGHPNTTRHHLRTLVADGLVVAQQSPSAGERGRPATRYAVTRAGRDAAAPGHRGAAAQEYVALAAAFAERLAQRGGDPGDDARAIGKAWGADLVARDAPVESRGDDAAPATAGRVLDLLDRLGFSPTTEPGEPVGQTVLLRTCPLLDAARRHPEVVCEVHLGLVAGAVEGLGEPSEGLHLEPFARPGACVLGLPATLVG